MLKYKIIGKRGKGSTYWLEVLGNTTHVSELAQIFEMQHVTLRNRLRSGWPIAAACTVPPENKWNSESINAHAQNFDFDTPFIIKFNNYFNK